MTTYINDILEGEDFYELMQEYRWIRGFTGNREKVLIRFEKIKSFIRKNIKGIENSDPKIDIKSLVEQCHTTAVEKGFWLADDNHIEPQDNPYNFSKNLMLIVTELAECCEADRKGKWDGKGGIPEELADTVIRIFDLCGGYDIDLEKAILKKMKKNKGRPHKHKKKY